LNSVLRKVKDVLGYDTTENDTLSEASSVELITSQATDPWDLDNYLNLEENYSEASTSETYDIMPDREKSSELLNPAVPDILIQAKAQEEEPT